jgi:hypothetical protein
LFIDARGVNGGKGEEGGESDDIWCREPEGEVLVSSTWWLTFIFYHIHTLPSHYSLIIL